ncbi:MAG TPA: hypothetical protein VES95_10320 [Dermatophilaceae bacterium]|nr:hypothetical protein [Dermatophilaceae bacterium]
MTDDPWDAWTAYLVPVLSALRDRESVLVAAPSSAARPHRRRKARLGGFLPARHEPVAPWVRLVRDEDHLRGWCVGPESTGGSLPMGPGEQEALLDLGWRRPGPADGEDLVRWWPDDVALAPYLPRADADAAAGTTAGTFRDVFGVSDPADLLVVEPGDPP